MNTYARLPWPDNPGVRARFTSTEAQIVVSRHRRWWQIWKPKRWEEVLVSTKHALRQSDHIQLVTAGQDAFALVVNNEPLLYWPPLEEGR